MASLFLTGGSGFIGEALLDSLAASTHDVTILVRTAGNPSRLDDRVKSVVGDLLEPDRWSDALAGADTVVHLAGLTGKAPAREYDRVNAIGTRNLIEASRLGGVKRFLAVSSIAVRFADAPGYHYARSKQRVELEVRASGLRYAIVRPTIVLGRRSPIGARLRALASLPLIPIPGSGLVRVQPIDVADLAGLLRGIIDEDRFDNEVIEAGGPDILTMRELLIRLHALLRGRSAPALGLPLAPIRAGLALAERVSLALAPVTAGQLAAFANDSTATPNPFVQSRHPQMKGIDTMLAELAR